MRKVLKGMLMNDISRSIIHYPSYPMENLKKLAVSYQEIMQITTLTPFKTC